MKLTPHNIVLDLETMGTGPNSAIMAIGAVALDIDTGDFIASFFATINWKESVDTHYRVTDNNTLAWWAKQSKPLLAELQRNPVPLMHGVQAFRAWCKQVKGETGAISMWGNGTAFDNVILKSAFDACAVPAPWHYTYDRCYRTLKGLYPEIKQPPLPVGHRPHHPVDDATAEAAHLYAILEHMRSREA